MAKRMQLTFINLPAEPMKQMTKDNKAELKEISLEEAEKSFSKKMERIMKDVFKFEKFRGLQQQVILTCLSGRDVFAVMPTGAGKSLCFQLPALILSGVTIVTSPLIALMQNQVQSLEKKGIKVALLNSSISKSERDKVYQDLRAISPTIKLLYVTPELLSTDFFLKLLETLDQKNKLSLFAIDEAHCISSWGHDFRPAFRKLSLLKQKFPHIPMIAMTATATKRVQEDITSCLGLKLNKDNFFCSSFDRPNITYLVRYKELLENPITDLKNFLKERKLTNSTGVIYCLQRSLCDHLAEELEKDGFSAKAYHANLTAAQRKSILEEWSSDQTKIVCATIAFGMGIDKPNVRFVIHFTLSKTLEAFYQESGRAGRDGRPSLSLMYYSKSDQSMMEYLIQKSFESENEGKVNQKPTEKDEQTRIGFEKMASYCTQPKCRRKTLLNYFGETNITCNNCDYCENPKQADQNINMALAFTGRKTPQLLKEDQLGLLLDSSGLVDEDEGDPYLFVDSETEQEKKRKRKEEQIEQSYVQKAMKSLPKNATKSQIFDALEAAEEELEKDQESKPSFGSFISAKTKFEQDSRKKAVPSYSKSFSTTPKAMTEQDSKQTRNPSFISAKTKFEQDSRKTVIPSHSKSFSTTPKAMTEQDSKQTKLPFNFNTKQGTNQPTKSSSSQSPFFFSEKNEDTMTKTSLPTKPSESLNSFFAQMKSSFSSSNNPPKNTNSTETNRSILAKRSFETAMQSPSSFLPSNMLLNSNQNKKQKS